jgi:hypothetical protein
MTPGETLPVTAAQVSVAGCSSSVRSVSVSDKRAVYAEYGLAYPQAARTYECDHFIPLCLGGSNSTENLWPEPHPEYHWKDGLEVYLWREVRAGRIGLSAAQRQIMIDWFAYWVMYGRPGCSADDSAALATVPVQVAKDVGSLVVCWSIHGKRYHYLSCRYVAAMVSANRRTGSVAGARAADKTPCRVCEPPAKRAMLLAPARSWRSRLP